MIGDVKVMDQTAMQEAQVRVMRGIGAVRHLLRDAEKAADADLGADSAADVWRANRGFMGRMEQWAESLTYGIEQEHLDEYGLPIQAFVNDPAAFERLALWGATPGAMSMASKVTGAMLGLRDAAFDFMRACIESGFAQTNRGAEEDLRVVERERGRIDEKTRRMIMELAEERDTIEAILETSGREYDSVIIDIADEALSAITSAMGYAGQAQATPAIIEQEIEEALAVVDNVIEQILEMPTPTDLPADHGPSLHHRDPQQEERELLARQRWIEEWLAEKQFDDAKASRVPESFDERVLHAMAAGIGVLENAARLKLSGQPRRLRNVRDRARAVRRSIGLAEKPKKGTTPEAMPTSIF